MITFLIETIAYSFLVMFLLALFNKLVVRRYEKTYSPEQLKHIHRVTVEKHNDTIYWFDGDTDEFLGQGLTVDDCIEHVKKRFPSHSFFFEIDEHQAIHLASPDWELKSIELNSQ